MKIKKEKINAALSFSLSLALVVLTFVFSDELGFAFRNLFKKSFSAGESIGEYINTPQKNNAEADEKTKAVIGFGSGKKSEESETDIPSDIKKLMRDAEKMYSGFEKTAELQEIALGSSNANTKYGKVAINNKTDRKPDVKALLKETPAFGKITKNEPYILIYHTHTTEGYELLDKGWYSKDYDSRTEDVSKTVVRVGDEIATELTKAGFKVIHDKTVYDRSYNGAYSRSLVTVEKYLKEYPSIVLTLDVHRDAIHYDSGVKCKPTAVINGKKAAQVMIITGCEYDGVEDFPDWEKNLTFAVALQNSVEENYEGLMRPIFFCGRKYNMNVTPCSLLLEFGTDANTLDEAVYSGRLVGKSLAKLLNENIN